MSRRWSFTHCLSTTKCQQLLLSRGSKRKEEKTRSNGNPHPATASSRKLSLGKGQSVIEEDESGATRGTQEWLLVHVARLNELVSELVCRMCARFSLKVIVDPQNHGFCSTVLLQCSLCEVHDKYCKSVYQHSDGALGT